MSNIEYFKQDMEHNFITPPEHIESTEKIVRFDINKKGDKSGWYVFFGDGGAYGNWSTGEDYKWCMQSNHEQTYEEKKAYCKQMQAAKEERVKFEKEEQEKAAKKAALLLKQSRPAPADHPYLQKKGVEPFGLHILNDGKLFMPMFDENNQITTYETISSDGEKRFAFGGKKKGSSFKIAGDDKATLGSFYIGEGFASCASARMATGGHTLVAADSGNLKAVALSLRIKYPDAKITVLADNDTYKKCYNCKKYTEVALELCMSCGKAHKQVNTGLLAAIEAAKAVNGLIALLEKKGSSMDWNDIHQEQGLDVVAVGITHAVALETFAKTNHEIECVDKTESKALMGEVVSLNLVQASSIKMEPIEWLWHHFLAKGKLHILAGQAGTGKTTIALDMAATVTKGGKWADRTQAPKGSVLIWSGEDDPADSLVPRLVASGADLKKVYFVGDMRAGKDYRSFDPASDMSFLLAEASKIPDLSLLIVDPIVSAVAGDSHKNAEVRKSLQPLVDLGMKANAAILGITHFTKGSKGADPAERVTGSLAFGALARLVMCTVKPLEEDDKPRFIRAKSNISPDGGGFEYTLARKELTDGIEGQHIEWGNALEGTATELMKDIEEKSNATSVLDETKAWLQDFLKDGREPLKDIKEAANAHCISPATLKRAKSELEVESKKMGKQWYWKLPYHSWQSDEEQLKNAEYESSGSTPMLETVEQKYPCCNDNNAVIPTKNHLAQGFSKELAPNDVEPVGKASENNVENGLSKQDEQLRRGIL